MLKSIGERDTALLPIGKTSETDEDSEDDDDVSTFVFLRPNWCEDNKNCANLQIIS